MEILDEIRKQVENEKRDDRTIYAHVKQLGLYMFTTNSMSKEQVVAFCSGIVSLYEHLHH